jgi:hypothetical protein
MIIIYQYNTMHELIFKYQTMKITNKYLICHLLTRIIYYRNNLSGIYSHNLWNHVIYILPFFFGQGIYCSNCQRGGESLALFSEWHAKKL